MEIIGSVHWKLKEFQRKNIELWMIEFVLENCKEFKRDKTHENCLVGIARIPQTGRKLKIVFRKIGKEKIKLITAYYI